MSDATVSHDGACIVLYCLECGELLTDLAAQIGLVDALLLIVRQGHTCTEQQP